MATKAIYTRVDGNYYKVNQDTTNPTEVVRMHRTHSQMNTNPAGKIVNSGIWINTLDTDIVRSNQETYDHMIEYFINNKVTEVPTIENRYVMYCDYSVFNYEGKEVNHNAFTRPIMPREAIYNLGVDRVSELVYKQVKMFETSISLNVKNDYPMGIMRNMADIKYTLHINDISIYQDLVKRDFDVHKSMDPNSYPISEVLSTMVKVYSTHENGMAIAAVEVPFIPRKIELDLYLTLDNNIVVYDDQDIIDIFKNNESGGSGGGTIVPGQTVIFNGGSATQ